jgi:hypothetical protein
MSVAGTPGRLAWGWCRLGMKVVGRRVITHLAADNSIRPAPG